MTSPRSLRRRRAVGGLLALAAFPLASRAADWPSKPVHIAVPAPAGSSLDIVARLLGERLAARWGEPVVVDNRPGAGGLIGTDVAAKAPPDGLTLTLSFNGPVAFAPFLYRKMPYDAARDLAPVVMTTSQPNVLAVNAAKVPAKTVKEFVEWAKAAHGAVNYASLGNGSSAHLTMELFMAEAGFQATHIPFNGSPPAALAVAQGEADAVFMVAPALLPHVRSGKVRLIAVSSAQPVESLKELPTLASAGYPAVESMAWNGLFAPAATPAAVIAKINADVNAVLAEPAVRTALDSQGLTPVGGSAADFRHVVEAEQKRWGPIIRKIGVTLD
ncbi:Bug family tripartite tricarboxylate transporter substrate binding protein [Ideonella sp. YS5]|uniref:Bug family tripartite tricarboxylate transporter substrate binding protein n=1 Tax=Ideonella sp. YS5 TaxID=3453714 RepID=UPI003EEE3A1B